MADDLEFFIRQQKAKLVKEREQLHTQTSPRFNQPHNGERSKPAVAMPPQYGDMPPRPGGLGPTPPKPATPQTGLVGRMGAYEDRRRRLVAERNDEYNQMISMQKPAAALPINVAAPLVAPSRAAEKGDRAGSRRGAGETTAYVSCLPGMSVRQSADARRLRLREERQQEYNSLIAAQEKRTQGRRSEVVAQRDVHFEKSKEDEYPRGPIAAVRNHPSAEHAKSEQRNREYNEFLRQKYSRPDRGGPTVGAKTSRIDLTDGDDEPRRRQRAPPGRPEPRQGWGTPTYEETLQQKRQDERRYRRYDDPELYNGAMRSSVSDGNLFKTVEDDDRFRKLDAEFDARRVRFGGERSRSGRADRGRGGAGGDIDDEFSQWLEDLKHKYDTPLAEYDNPSAAQSARTPRTRRSDLPQSLPPPRRQNSLGDDTFGASLPIPDSMEIGHTLSEAESQRRKRAYSNELLQQIEETRRGRTTTHSPAKPAPAPSGEPIDNYRKASPDNYSLRHQVQADRRPAKEGILERGWDDLSYPAALQRPLFTDSGSPPRQGGLGQPYKSPIDEAYHYYGMKNILDPNPESKTGLDTYPHQPVPTPTPAVSKASGVDRGRVGQLRGTSMLDTSIDANEKRQKDKKAVYQADLLRQIEEQKEKKRRQKLDDERYDRKLEDECRAYDPYGKSGAGAAMKDRDGNLVTNLRDMHLDNEKKWRTPVKTAAPAPAASTPDVADGYRAAAAAAAATAATLSPRQPTLDAGDSEKTFARGGHGIFGEPMTDLQKTQQQKYQDDLRKQIEEKKRKAEEEKARQMEEDEKLMQRIADENRKMEEEVEREKTKERGKLEQAERMRVELKRVEEERKRAVVDARREADERRQEEARRRLDEETRLRQEQEDEDRSVPAPVARSASQERSAPSPPVHALRSKTDISQPPQQPQDRQSRGKSPPVPARAPSRESKAPSSNVLSQLARMRQQLQTERRRVEQDLKKTREDPEVYDPRLSEKPPIPPLRGVGNVDVFEVARHREPVSVRRPPTEANETNLREFNQLKNKGGSGSRAALRSMYPESPSTGSALEEQQRALLTQQEEGLRRMKKSPYERALPHMNPKDLGLTRDSTMSSTAMLDSESAFIAMANGDNFGSRATLNSAASRQQLATPRTPKSVQSYDMGSVQSLNPDKINSRNEERMRKLRQMTAGDDISLADPDDILDRFMARQQHRRPPSETTLQDDSWLRPASHSHL